MHKVIMGIALFALSLAHAGEFGQGAAIADVLDSGMHQVLDDGSAASSDDPPIERTAYDAVREYADSRGFHEGWDSEKERYFTIAASTFNTVDPKSNPDFYLHREMAAKRAILEAKVNVISFIESRMTASEQVLTPGTDLNHKFTREYEALNEKMNAQRDAMVTLLKQVDAREADQLAGVTYGDRFKALMDGLIKRLDREYSQEGVMSAKRVALEDVKRNYHAAKEQFEQLQEQAENLPSRQDEVHTNSMAIAASRPLSGGVVIKQYESWDESTRQYEIAVLFCWSRELERTADAIIHKKDYVVKATSSTEPVSKWLSKQKLGAMVGPLQYVDADGNRYFIAVSARPVLANAKADRDNRAAARLFSRQMALFSLYSDIDAYEEARQLLRPGRGVDDMASHAAAETLEQRLRQQYENPSLSGLTTLYQGRVRHPLTKQMLHVHVSGLSPLNAVEALRLKQRLSASDIVETPPPAVEPIANDQPARRALTQNGHGGRTPSGVVGNDYDPDDF